jgi:hypothetical protein
MMHQVTIHENEEDEKKENDEEKEVIWQSCCGVPSDRRLLTFVSVFSISIGVLSFCFSQLAIGTLNKDREMFYISLITLIIGVWIKSPL